MSNDDFVLQRLDRIIFLLGLAFREQLDAARRRVLSDPVAAALVETAADDWIAAGDLKRRVAVTTKQSERTVSRRLSQLVVEGWIEAVGAGANVRYRSGGWA